MCCSSNERDIQDNVVFNDDGFTVDSCWFIGDDLLLYLHGICG